MSTFCYGFLDNTVKNLCYPEAHTLMAGHLTAAEDNDVGF